MRVTMATSRGWVAGAAVTAAAGAGAGAAAGAVPARQASARARTSAPRLLAALAAAGVLAGCGSIEPWVKPYERERLADPIMKFSRGALADKHAEHVRDVREAAHGATGVQGGGCGCK
jgi:hypothetical protein